MKTARIIEGNCQITYGLTELTAIQNKGGVYLLVIQEDLTLEQGTVLSWHKSEGAANKAAKAQEKIDCRLVIVERLQSAITEEIHKIGMDIADNNKAIEKRAAFAAAYTAARDPSIPEGGKDDSAQAAGEAAIAALNAPAAPADDSAAAKREIMLAKKRAGMAALRARRKLEAESSARIEAAREQAEAQRVAERVIARQAEAQKQRAEAAAKRVADTKREAAELKAAAQRESDYRAREKAMLAAQYLEAQTAQRNFEAHTAAPAGAALDLSAALAAVRTWFAYSAFGKLLLAALCNQYNRRHWLQQALADGDWQKVRLCTMGGSELDVLTFELSITKCRFNAHLCRRRIAGLLELAESESAAVQRHSLSAGTAY